MHSKTQEELELIRQNGMRKHLELEAKGAATIEAQIEEFINLIRQNKGHIGGLLLAIVPKLGTQLVDEAGDSVFMVRTMATSSPTSCAMLRDGAEALIEQIPNFAGYDAHEQRRGGLPPELAELLNNIDSVNVLRIPRDLLKPAGEEPAEPSGIMGQGSKFDN